MTSDIAMLRTMNVAGTGKLPMTKLKRIGECCGFATARNMNGVAKMTTMLA